MPRLFRLVPANPASPHHAPPRSGKAVTRQAPCDPTRIRHANHLSQSGKNARSGPSHTITPQACISTPANRATTNQALRPEPPRHHPTQHRAATSHPPRPCMKLPARYGPPPSAIKPPAYRSARRAAPQNDTQIASGTPPSPTTRTRSNLHAQEKAMTATQL